MTVRLLSQCLTCSHWVSPLVRSDDAARGEDPTQICDAFPLPQGIPDDIWWNAADHRQPYRGDHGIQWASDGDPFPDWVLVSEQ